MSSTGSIRFRVVDVAAMLKTAPPPIPWVVENMLVPGEVTILVGREGRGKSMLSQLVGMAVADPNAVEGVPGLNGRHGRVLVIDAENGQPLIHRRLYSAGLRDASNYAVREAIGVDLRNAGHRQELVEIIQENRPDLVVLDSLASLAPGIKENDAEAMAPFMLAVQSVARSTGAAVLLLHHAAKAGDGSQYRGSSAIGGVVTIEMAMIAHEGDPDSQRRELRWGKVRPIQRPTPLWVRLTSDGGPLRADPTEPYEGPGDSDAPSAAEHVAARMTEIVGLLGPLSRGDLCQKVPVGAGSGTAGRAIEMAIADGRLVRVRQGWYGPAGAREVND